MVTKKLALTLVLLSTMLVSGSPIDSFNITKLELRDIPKRESGCNFIIEDKLFKLLSYDAKPIFIDYENDNGQVFGIIKINNNIIELPQISERFYDLKKKKHGQIVWRKGSLTVSVHFKFIELTEGSANWKGKLIVEDGNNKKSFQVFVSCSDEL